MAAGLNDPGADRARDLGLLVFRAAERVAAFGLDLGLVMGSSEVCATPSVAPPQPRPANRPAGQDPVALLSRPKSPQQRSDQARKPVNSEQDSCSSVPTSEVSMAAVHLPIGRLDFRFWNPAGRITPDGALGEFILELDFELCPIEDRSRSAFGI